MKKQAPTISFHTIGCRTNQYDTAVLRNLFAREGFSVITEEKSTDIAVINTCTVTENSDRDTRKMVNRLVRLNPNVRIALVGCQAQLQPKILQKLPNVSWVVGNQEKFQLADIMARTGSSEKCRVVVPPIDRADAFCMNGFGIDDLHTRVNLKIQDGCDNFCTYCAVPYARGPARSREFEDIIKEAQCLARAGHKEVVLTGINIGAYRFKQKTIVDVVKALEDIDGVKRIRISSIEPTAVLKKLISCMAGSTKLCRHLHIPIQHGDNAVLKRMGRRYTAADVADLIALAHTQIPDICLGTDAIVGFPGETPEHFSTMYALLKAMPLSYFHVFSFSPRIQARAKNFKNRIPSEDIQARSQKLRSLGQRKRRQFYERMIGRTMAVLFEQQKNGCWKGITDNFIPVQVLTGKDLKNSIYRVQLTHRQGQAVDGILKEKIYG